jgi:hypothetical protein
MGLFADEKNVIFQTRRFLYLMYPTQIRIPTGFFLVSQIFSGGLWAKIRMRPFSVDGMSVSMAI